MDIQAIKYVSLERGTGWKYKFGRCWYIVRNDYLLGRISLRGDKSSKTDCGYVCTT